MGHIPFSWFKLVQPYMNTNTCLPNVLCQICPAARQTKKSFFHTSIKITFILELLHTDVWGPYKTKASSSCALFSTKVDDFGRFT